MVERATPRTRELRVLIIGGGLCGLLLAHGLRRDGHRVTVFERRSETGDDLPGFGIHLHPQGVVSMRECLPDANWAAFDRAAGDGGHSVGFYDEKLAVLTDFDDGFARRSIGRLRLREILLSGLEDVTEFSKQFESYEVLDDGSIRAHFADGSSAVGDVLVGADGARSAVREQYLPDLNRIDLGALSLAGRTVLTPELVAMLPEHLIDGAPNNILPSRDSLLFLSAWRLGEAASDAADDYVVWSYSTHKSHLPTDFETLTTEQQLGLVLDRMTDWAPGLRRVISDSQRDSVTAILPRTMPKLTPWPSSAVTLMGDAVHNMTPHAGIGANTALRDSHHLRSALAEVLAGHSDLISAIARYEAEMRAYANSAISQSARNTRTAAANSPLGRSAFHTVLRLSKTRPRMKAALLATPE